MHWMITATSQVKEMRPRLGCSESTYVWVPLECHGLSIRQDLHGTHDNVSRGTLTNHVRQCIPWNRGDMHRGWLQGIFYLPKYILHGMMMTALEAVLCMAIKP